MPSRLLLTSSILPTATADSRTNYEAYSARLFYCKRALEYCGGFVGQPNNQYIDHGQSPSIAKQACDEAQYAYN